MTQSPDNGADMPHKDLQSLYREQAEAEPDSGLDRIIRARAEQALESDQRRRPRPWIAGLATAGALVLAVGVIVQQAPQQAPPPSPQESASAPSAISEDAAPAARSALPRPAADAQLQSAPAPELTTERAFLSGLAETQAQAKAQAVLDIRALLADGQIEAARERVRALRESQPELELPEDLLEALEKTPRNRDE
ncbi:hypothetical protein [Wenzhouxiangella limi]|uniref:Uncharacterized protein n=1 Tax=Wenzhouxiangella limi TaxID=2707351 RepID=A0A845UUL5_9GAMM|nr:hypothetical protein [Wenzhouxiangella limi]NDY95523.1 hypothetical protein [Wenzhouxiangella limi]